MGWNNSAITQLMIIAAGSGFSGFFVYAPAPGKGNLILAVAASAGTDPYGNSYRPVFNAGVWSASTGNMAQHFGIDANGGVSVVGPDGKTRMFLGNNPPAFIAYNDFGAIVTYIDPVNSAIWQYTDTGSAVQGALVFAQAGMAATDPVTSVAVNAGTNVIGAGGMSVTAAAGNVATIAGGSSAPKLVTSAGANAAGFSGFIGVAEAADNTQHVVSGTTFGQFSAQHNYTTNDAVAGTIYRCTVLAAAHMGNTVVNSMQFEFSGGQAVCILQPNMGVGTIAYVRIVAEVVVLTTGPGGTANYFLTADVGPANGEGVTTRGFSQPGAFITSSPGTLELFSNWGGVNAGQSMTCYSSWWERLGP